MSFSQRAWVRKIVYKIINMKRAGGGGEERRKGQEMFTLIVSAILETDVVLRTRPSSHRIAGRSSRVPAAPAAAPLRLLLSHSKQQMGDGTGHLVNGI